MSPDLIVIRSVNLQDIAQVRFAEHDEVVERFTTYRSDESLNVAVLPRRAWRGRVIPDPYCTNRPSPGWADQRGATGACPAAAVRTHNGALSWRAGVL